MAKKYTVSIEDVFTADRLDDVTICDSKLAAFEAAEAKAMALDDMMYGAVIRDDLGFTLVRICKDFEGNLSYDGYDRETALLIMRGW